MKINHTRLFFHSLRSALLFVASFVIYDILAHIEKTRNTANPENVLYHFYGHKALKFVLILIMDLLILYGITFAFGIEL